MRPSSVPFPWSFPAPSLGRSDPMTTGRRPAQAGPPPRELTAAQGRLPRLGAYLHAELRGRVSVHGAGRRQLLRLLIRRQSNRRPRTHEAVALARIKTFVLQGLLRLYNPLGCSLRSHARSLAGLVGQLVLDHADAWHATGKLRGAGAGPNARNGTREDDRPAVGAHTNLLELSILRQAAFHLTRDALVGGVDHLSIPRRHHLQIVSHAF